jgi:2-polyprenyl-3-methyl-5-hydroxy-6-metoxy-1,4-benzoquinol methylase
MNCPVCLNPATRHALTGTDLLFETTSRTFNLNSCSACDCFFLNPMPGGEEIAGFYPDQYWWKGARPGVLKRLESLYRRVVLHDHVSFIIRATRNLARNAGEVELLDVGCGSGTLMGILKHRGFRVLGVDFSREAASVAEIENGVQVLVGPLEQASFKETTFDVVTLFHVMEHVANPRDLLSEIRRILKPDGCLILQVPNIDSWQSKVFGAQWYGLDIPRHLIDYSKAAMLRLLSDSGFSVRRIRHFNLRDNAPALVSSIFPSLDPVSRAVRHQRHDMEETATAAWARHLSYLFFVLCAWPIAMIESAFGHGATIMIEARRK